MSQFIGIFCRSDEPLEVDDVTAFIQETWYGDEAVTVRPELAADAAGTDWRSLEITLPGMARPVRIEREPDRRKVSELVAEILEELDPEVSEEISARLNETRQAIGVEFYPEGFTEDVWELFDVVLAMFARRLDGLVVDDEAVYDKELQRLLER